MAEQIRFQCLNCRHRFEAQTLTQEEKEEARRQDRPTYPIGCPMCRRTDIRRGWS
ncbi:zinc ribbon domain-containing protein [Rubellimicrobium rubrum]|uniref:Zinc ribbon domain-containing protein n=1 Tax=Rubellimicrobium rubrum TaxID=2585369 RepID=A0A5C4MLQ1_9RHOB|nr:zinc ribbon domain-containing protein [Rubellimicrobium rubrum]